MKAHKAAVKEIAHKVRNFYKQNIPFRISHGSTNSTRNPHDTPTVDTSTLSNVIQIDVENKICTVQPNVPMDRLVATTLQHNLVPPVVMEFPGITVGGGYAGTSGESSSFRHGFFDRTIKSVEMIIGNGDVVVATPDNEHSDLFHGGAGAVGSLGIATLVELQLIDAQPFVETEYHPVSSMSEARDIIATATMDESIEYVDGIMYAADKGAVITGRLATEPLEGVSIQSFSRPEDPWFYLHVLERIGARTSKTTVKEIVPLDEYLFRYDRGGFWVGDSAFKYTGVPNNKWTRWFLDDFLHTRMLYRALHASGSARQYLVQDLALPDDTVEEFVEYIERELDIWPLWLCPLKQSPRPSLHPHDCRDPPATEEDGVTLAPMLNLGVWGEPKNVDATNYNDFVEMERKLERELTRLGGMKWGYGKHFYDRSDFWEMFQHPNPSERTTTTSKAVLQEDSLGRTAEESSNVQWYDDLRRKYHGESLPTMWDKITVNVERERERRKNDWRTKVLAVWPLGGAYSIWKAIQSKDYLHHRK
jgi:FAD/FMN-containing dehydrogenase